MLVSLAFLFLFLFATTPVRSPSLLLLDTTVPLRLVLLAFIPRNATKTLTYRIPFLSLQMRRNIESPHYMRQARTNVFIFLLH